MAGWRVAGGPAGDPFELAWPLDDDALEDLRWYLEDYLRAPFGVYEDRGPAIAAALPGWGEALFERGCSVRAPRGMRTCACEPRARAGVEVVFASASPALAGVAVGAAARPGPRLRRWRWTWWA